MADPGIGEVCLEGGAHPRSRGGRHCFLVGCDSSTSNPDRSASFVGEWDGELRESRLEAWMKSRKSEVAIA